MKLLLAIAAAAGTFALLGSADATTMGTLTCGQSVTTSVTLTANIDCSSYGGPFLLSVDADNVTLNLNGHTIIGPGSGASGPFEVIGVVDDNAGMTLENGNVVNVDIGVAVEGAGPDVVANSTVTKITFNLGGSHEYNGVEAYGGNHNTFTHLTGTNLKQLVWISHETDDTISSNTASGGSDSFEDENGRGDTWSGNKAYADGDNSFTCSSCSGVTFQSNYS
jgi:hypothetical protein